MSFLDTPVPKYKNTKKSSIFYGLAPQEEHFFVYPIFMQHFIL
jgi:hypothetical protein